MAGEPVPDHGKSVDWLIIKGKVTQNLPRITNHPVLGSSDAPKKIAIVVDGVEIEAVAGEPVAAAMWAAGVRAIRTMPGTGDPRGIFTGIGRSLEELGTVDGELNVPMMFTPVAEGMIVETRPRLCDRGGPQ